MAEVLEKKITVQAFQEMEFPENDFFIYELINGVIMRKAASQPAHQFVVRRLSKAFEAFLDAHPMGEFLTSPIDVFFDEYNRTQPDVLFIVKDRMFIIDLVNGIMGAPDLIVEVISPGSVTADKVLKKDLYLRFGVKEYWLVDLHNKTVELYVLKNNQYVMQQFLEIEGMVESTVLIGLELNIRDLF